MCGAAVGASDSVGGCVRPECPETCDQHLDVVGWDEGVGPPKPLCCRFSSVCAKRKQGIDREDDAEGENEDRRGLFFFCRYIFH